MNLPLIRYPSITKVADNGQSQHFIVHIETNGDSPYWTDLTNPGTFTDYAGTEHKKGMLFRVDVTIPASDRDNPIYIAREMMKAWETIWRRMLYARPGRFIPVNGDPRMVVDEGATSIQFFETPLLPPCPYPWCGTGKVELGEKLVPFTKPEKVTMPPNAQALVDAASEVNEKTFSEMLDDIYRRGGSPDIVYTTLERLYERGYIGFWEFQWRKLLRQVGRWKRSVTSGARSAPPKRGMMVPAVSVHIQTASGTSSVVDGEPSTSSSPTHLSLSGCMTPYTTPTLAGTKDTSSRGESGPSPESPSSTR